MIHHFKYVVLIMYINVYIWSERISDY